MSCRLGAGIGALVCHSLEREGVVGYQAIIICLLQEIVALLISVVADAKNGVNITIHVVLERWIPLG